MARMSKGEEEHYHRQQVARDRKASQTRYCTLNHIMDLSLVMIMGLNMLYHLPATIKVVVGINRPGVSDLHLTDMPERAY